MSKNIAYIINSAPGIGKSTLIKNLHTRLPNGFALIDGDDVGRISPYENSIKWLNVMQDNIADCCANFKLYGFDNCVVTFVFPVKERLERMKGLLTVKGFETLHVILECDEDEMCRRITQRNTSKLINTEKAKELNKALKILNADFRIDTTYTNAEDVANKVLEYIAGGIL